MVLRVFLLPVNRRRLVEYLGYPVSSELISRWPWRLSRRGSSTLGWGMSRQLAMLRRCHLRLSSSSSSSSRSEDKCHRLTDIIDMTLCKIEFTYQSQKHPNLKVVKITKKMNHSIVICSIFLYHFLAYPKSCPWFLVFFWFLFLTKYIFPAKWSTFAYSMS